MQTAREVALVVSWAVVAVGRCSVVGCCKEWDGWVLAGGRGCCCGGGTRHAGGN